MIIGLVIYGKIHGHNGPKKYDIRHCYPNTQRMIVDPLRQQGHEVRTFICTYPVDDADVLADFYTMTQPANVTFCEVAGSSQFTTKTRAFECFKDAKDLDLVVFSRSDIHYSVPIDKMTLDPKKFNFLFRERNHWDNLKYTTDNFYAWPHSMTPLVEKAMAETISTARAQGRVDTHNLYTLLCQYIPSEEIHFASEQHSLSDVNPFYTLCLQSLSESRFRCSEK